MTLWLYLEESQISLIPVQHNYLFCAHHLNSARNLLVFAAYVNRFRTCKGDNKVLSLGVILQCNSTPCRIRIIKSKVPTIIIQQGVGLLVEKC